MTRLTFVGDIALDKPLLRAAKERGNGQFDFSNVFQTKDVFSDSDLVIGNLETCFGGGNHFNKKPYHYNSPDSFCKAIKDAGINLVSTANNHCMDEGVVGLRRTLQQLDASGIEHTGTFADNQEKRYLIKELDGIRIAFYSLTYSVNSCFEANECDDLYEFINLTGFAKNKQPLPIRYLRIVVKPKIYQFIKKRLGKSTITAHTDLFKKEKINREWFADIEKQIRNAKQESDLLVVLLHSGGQFNIEPGDFSKYMMDKMCSLGANIVIGNHSHTVQRIERRGGKVVAFSLGGYCMSVSGEYLVHDCLPEYSVALHIDIENKNVSKCSADILKGTEDEHGYLAVRKANDDDSHKILIRTGILSNNYGGNNEWDPK